MKYVKVAFSLSPNMPEAGELLIALLGEQDFESFEITDVGFDAYIPENLFHPDILSELTCPIPHIVITHKFETLPDQNWNKIWEENYFQPIKIGNEVIIRGSFHEKDDSVKYDLLIEPKMAFGTGHHATTSLMIKYILELDCSQLNVLDMGCGTGVLGILCAMKGASQVIGIDIEEWAYQNAIENCAINKVTNMSIIHGDAGDIGDRTFDLIIANINRNILLKDMSNYARALAPKGRLLLSGFYSEDVPVIKKEADKYNLSYQSSKIDNNWMALAYIKPEH